MQTTKSDTKYTQTRMAEKGNGRRVKQQKMIHQRRTKKCPLHYFPSRHPKWELKIHENYKLSSGGCATLERICRHVVYRLPSFAIRHKIQPHAGKNFSQNAPAENMKINGENIAAGHTVPNTSTTPVAILSGPMKSQQCVLCMRATKTTTKN